MKRDNPLWGCRRISDELKKLGIELHHTTVNKIIQTFRKNGQIQPVGTWKKFLKAHWNSLFGMDFMTADTLFGKRLYLLIILEHKSRKGRSFQVYIIIITGAVLKLVFLTLKLHHATALHLKRKQEILTGNNQYPDKIAAQ